MGGVQRQHNPWLGAQELVHRTPISEAMRPVIEKRVSRVTRRGLGNFVLASEMLVPFTHRYAEEHAAEIMEEVGDHMRGVLREGKRDFEGYCPGFRIVRAKVPLTSSAIPRPSILALSTDTTLRPDNVGAALEVLIMRTNRLLPEDSPLQVPQ